MARLQLFELLISLSLLAGCHSLNARVDARSRDIATTSSPPHRVSHPSGAMHELWRRPMKFGRKTPGITAGDFDRSGRQEIAVRTPSGITILSADGKLMRTIKVGNDTQFLASFIGGKGIRSSGLVCGATGQKRPARVANRYGVFRVLLGSTVHRK